MYPEQSHDHKVQDTQADLKTFPKYTCSLSFGFLLSDLLFLGTKKKNFTNLSGDHDFLSCETEHRLERLKKPIKEFRPDLKKLLSILAFNPLTSITVLHVISSCNINTLSSETVSRIHKFI